MTTYNLQGHLDYSQLWMRSFIPDVEQPKIIGMWWRPILHPTHLSASLKSSLGHLLMDQKLVQQLCYITRHNFSVDACACFHHWTLSCNECFNSYLWRAPTSPTFFPLTCSTFYMYGSILISRRLIKPKEASFGKFQMDGMWGPWYFKICFSFSANFWLTIVLTFVST
jgi:hypothetical protein